MRRIYFPVALIVFLNFFAVAVYSQDDVLVDPAYSNEAIQQKIETAGYALFAKEYLASCAESFPQFEQKVLQPIQKIETAILKLDAYFNAAPEYVKKYYDEKKNSTYMLDIVAKQKAISGFTPESCKNYIQNTTSKQNKYFSELLNS